MRVGPRLSAALCPCSCSSELDCTSQRSYALPDTSFCSSRCPFSDIVGFKAIQRMRRCTGQACSSASVQPYFVASLLFPSSSSGLLLAYTTQCIGICDLGFPDADQMPVCRQHSVSRTLEKNRGDVLRSADVIIGQMSCIHYLQTSPPRRWKLVANRRAGSAPRKTKNTVQAIARAGV